jgi:hypothetical protein
MWGIGLRWLRDRKVVEDYHILHGSEETDEYRLSPIRATIERGTPLQRRLDRPVLGSRAQGVFGRASPAHDRPAKGSHATPPLPLRRVAQNSAQRRLVCRVTEARPPAEGNSRSCFVDRERGAGAGERYCDGNRKCRVSVFRFAPRQATSCHINHY